MKITIVRINKLIPKKHSEQQLVPNKHLLLITVINMIWQISQYFKCFTKMKHV